MEEPKKQRLSALDGLRAVAALGVLWIHSWTAHGNPRFAIGKIDVTSILALGGNGVDLFFVISGFCMYYFYASKTSFSYLDFWAFLKKRWIRLSPAFYVATIVYVAYRWNDTDISVIIPKLLTSVLYLNSLSKYNAEGFFWSLGTEWQFYMIIPFLFIYQNKSGFYKAFITISALLFLIAIGTVLILKKDSDIITLQIIFRYFEFACGIITARFMLVKTEKEIPYRWLWLIIFIALSYIGRFLISDYVLRLSILYYNVFKLAGFTIMCSGFAGIIYLSLTSKTVLLHLLGNRIISFMGQISYSFYLWHGLINLLVSDYIIANYAITGVLAPISTFLICTVILAPVSYLSYLLLEKPFMAVKPKQRLNNH